MGEIGQRIRFAIVGGGFRANYYLKVAYELPERFKVCGLSTGNPQKTLNLREQMGVIAYPTVKELLRAENPEFLVVCKKRNIDAGEIMDDIVQLGIPVLMETPAAWDYEGLKHIYQITLGKKVQVAEQLYLQPENSARLSIAASGLLGTVSQVEISYLHTYHGMSVMRKFLGIGFENADIYACSFAYPAVQGYMRSGISEKETIVCEKREFAVLDFGNKLGIYNYENNQNRSYVRSDHLTVRGERGEIHDQTVLYLIDHKTPACYTYERIYAGSQANLEGFFLHGVMGAGQWLFRNPYPQARFCDDEIAVASNLDRMGNYARGGKEFYSVREACQDQYLSLMISQAAKEGRMLRTETQPWAVNE